MKPVFDVNGLALEPGDVRCYYYDSITNEYIGWSDEYINVGVSMPENSTNVEPSPEKTGMISLFMDNSWELQEDHRGETVWSTADGSVATVDYIGPIRDGYTVIAPRTPYDKWESGNWVTDMDAQHAAFVTTAEIERQVKIAKVNDFINSKQWPVKAAIGCLKDVEKAQYNECLDYLETIEDIDTTMAPYILWPDELIILKR